MHQSPMPARRIVEEEVKAISKKTLAGFYLIESKIYSCTLLVGMTLPSRKGDRRQTADFVLTWLQCLRFAIPICHVMS